MRQPTLSISPLIRQAPVAFRLLVTACRVYLGTIDVAVLQQQVSAMQPQDWSEVEKLAAVHRIRPIAYRSLSKIHPIPAEVLDGLKKSTLGITHKAFECEILASEVAALAEASGIRLRPYKGTDLAKVVYGDIGLREFTDIDFVVNTAQVPHLFTFLEQNHAVIAGADYYKAAPQQYAATQKDLVCTLPGRAKKFSFEFHYRPAPNYLSTGLEFDQLFIDHGTGSLTSASYYHVMTLNHGMVDLYPGLRELVDLAMLIKTTHAQPALELLSDYYLLNEYLVQQFFGLNGSSSFPARIRQKGDAITKAMIRRIERKRIKTATILRVALAFRKGVAAKYKLALAILRFFLTPGAADAAAPSRILRLLKGYKKHI